MPAYKDNKTGKWFCQFRYTEWTGEVKQKRKRGFALKREAEQWEKDFLEQHDFTNKKKTRQCIGISFNNFVTMYFADIDIRKTTERTKWSMFNHHLLPYFQDLKMDEITPAHILRWQQAMLKKNFSASYLRSLHAQLVSVFNHAERFYGLRDNPCRSVSAIGKARPKEMKFWTLEQYQKVLSVVPDNDIWFKLVLETLFWSGCRVGELLALKPNDFSQPNLMRIDETFVVVDGEEIFNNSKTDCSQRTVSIPDFIYNRILEYINQLYGISDDDRIFMFTNVAVACRLNKYADRAGVERIRVHDLRHPYVKHTTKNILLKSRKPKLSENRPDNLGFLLL